MIFYCHADQLYRHPPPGRRLHGRRAHPRPRTSSHPLSTGHGLPTPLPRSEPSLVPATSRCDPCEPCHLDSGALRVWQHGRAHPADPRSRPSSLPGARSSCECSLEPRPGMFRRLPPGPRYPTVAVLRHASKEPCRAQLDFVVDRQSARPARVGAFDRAALPRPSGNARPVPPGVARHARRSSASSPIAIETFR